MKTVRSGNAVYLIRACGDAPAPPRRRGIGVLARTAGVAALAVGLALGLAAGEAPAVGSARTEDARPAAAAPAAKEGARLAAWHRPAAAPATAMAAVAATAAATAETAPIFAPRLAAAPAQARFAKGDPAVTGSLLPGAFAPRASEWREEEFQQVQALDGRTLAAPSLRIRLSGLELPQAGEVCRTLDGRLEPCALRAAAQLDLMTRHRKVTCRYLLESKGEASGTCRIGTSDLAERMVRTGFAKRAPGAGQLALAPAAFAAN